jgi:hypothetical protein
LCLRCLSALPDLRSGENVYRIAQAIPVHFSALAAQAAVFGGGIVLACR